MTNTNRELRVGGGEDKVASNMDPIKAIENFFLGPTDESGRLETFPFGTGWMLDQPKFPPYDFYQLNNSDYVLEMAVAGLRRSDLDIQYDEDNRILTVSGGVSKEDDNIFPSDAGKFIHKGIARRSFTRYFKLHEKMIIKDCWLEDGLLKISFEKDQREGSSMRKIEIN